MAILNQTCFIVCKHSDSKKSRVVCMCVLYFHTSARLQSVRPKYQENSEIPVLRVDRGMWSMDFWCCKCCISSSNPMADKKERARYTTFRSQQSAVSELGTFGNPRHHNIKEFMQSGEEAEALLLLWCYYLLISFLALDNVIHNVVHCNFGLHIACMLSQ